jgi:hypothetical protein
MIKRSSRSLLIRAAGEAPDLYSKEYLAELETHSPFRFAFLNDQRKRLASRSGLLGSSAAFRSPTRFRSRPSAQPKVKDRALELESEHSPL